MTNSFLNLKSDDFIVISFSCSTKYVKQVALINQETGIRFLFILQKMGE